MFAVLVPLSGSRKKNWMKGWICLGLEKQFQNQFLLIYWVKFGTSVFHPVTLYQVSEQQVSTLSIEENIHKIDLINGYWNDIKIGLIWEDLKTKEELSTAMNIPQKGKLPSSLNESAASDIKTTEKVTNEINNGNVEFMMQQINHELEGPSNLSIVQKHTMKHCSSSTPPPQPHSYSQNSDAIVQNLVQCLQISLVRYGFQHGYSEKTSHFQN